MANMLPPPKPRAKVDNRIPPSEMKYVKPSWSGKGPRGSAKFEVVKEGSLLDIVKINSEVHVVGRDPRCDTVIEHPSSSRQHAVFQLDKSDSVYIFDCESAHGTFVNKKMVKANTHVKLQHGDRVSFGSSTRSFILDVPREEEEEQPKTTITTEQQLFNSSKESIKDLVLPGAAAAGRGSDQETVSNTVTKDNRLEDVIGFDEDDEFYDRTVPKKKSKKAKKVTASTLKKEVDKQQQQLDDLQCERNRALASITVSSEELEKASDDPHERYIIEASLTSSKDQLKKIDQNIKALETALQKTNATLKSALPVLPELKSEQKRKASQDEIKIVKIPKKEVQSKPDAAERLKAQEVERQQRREERTNREKRSMNILSDIQADLKAHREKAAVSSPATPKSQLDLPTNASTDSVSNPTKRGLHSADQNNEDSWVQPKGQTGDGRCALNDLLGY